MSTRRRSLFLYIALLCTTVFCQYTAHFAKTASQPFRLTPCRAKVAAVSVLPESKLKVRVRRATRLPQIAARYDAAQHFGLPSSSLTAAAISSQRVSLLDRSAESAAPQFRAFYLRV
jgi:hypothetical protein